VQREGKRRFTLHRGETSDSLNDALNGIIGCIEKSDCFCRVAKNPVADGNALDLKATTLSRLLF